MLDKDKVRRTRKVQRECNICDAIGCLICGYTGYYFTVEQVDDEEDDVCTINKSKQEN